MRPTIIRTKLVKQRIKNREIRSWLFREIERQSKEIDNFYLVTKTFFEMYKRTDCSNLDLIIAKFSVN